MRINARLDEETQRQIEYITAATGQSVSHVVRESLARYYAEVKARQLAPMKFLALVGQGDSGRDDLSTNYKQLLAESLAAKHGLSPR